LSGRHDEVVAGQGYIARPEEDETQAIVVRVGEGPRHAGTVSPGRERARDGKEPRGRKVFGFLGADVES